MMQIEIFTVGPFTENTYLLVQEGEALLIDPGFFQDEEFQSFQHRLHEEYDAALLAVVLTHAHVDHMLGLQRVLDVYDVPVYLSDVDRYLWSNFGSQARMFGLPATGISIDPEPLSIGKGWSMGSFKFDVLYTPGHSPDHVSLYNGNERFVIAGDALFRQGIGRTDLYKGDFKLLEKSIREQLYTLPDNTVVYPGHGPETTIGYEKQNNPFVTELVG
jgi:glyoxylase-like metal-dependent hydrolase (beta-lactamase superfamily II)